MGKKNMVMRRIAALLIASLVVTSSAFTSLADYYFLNEDQKTSTVELEVGGESKEIVVEYASNSNTEANKATNSVALAENVVWTSENTSIATVEGSGFRASVAPVGVGTTTVKAEAEGKTISFTVNVKAKSEPEAEATLTLSPKIMTLKVGGEDGKLNATVMQGETVVTDAKITWVLSKQGVVTVSEDGVVHAQAAGTVKVTAETTVGKQDLKDTCEVTVEKAADEPEPENPVFALQLDKENVKLILGEEATLVAKVTKDGEEVKADKIEWTLEGKNIGTIVDGKITSTALGRALAVATATVGNESLRAECEVIVAPKLAIDKQTLTMFEGATAKINVTELSEGADIEKWYIGDEEAGITSEIIEKVGSDTEKSFTIKALKAGTEVVTVWAGVKDGEEFHFFNFAECAVEVLPVPAQTVVEDIEVPEIPATEEEKFAEVFEDVEKAKESIAEQTTKIQEAVTAAVKEAVIEPAEDIKEIFKNIEEIPEDSEVKLLSVKAAVAIEKDDKGNPIKDENGNPIVVVQKLTYHISVVTSEGKVVPHSALENNETLISIDVPLPAQGIKDEWRFAEIKHYADEECTDLINTLYSRIYGSGDSKYITIKTTKFSPFVMEFSVESKEPVATPSRPSSSGGSSGGGSRRHVVGGGGSSTNSYSMTGNWVMGANGWTFVKSDGQTAANTWGWINGQYYYFDANGNMMTGWQFINGKWYYLNPAEGSLQGAMLSGVLYDPAYNAYFYADASGAMVTGWYQVGANWYYFSPVNDGVHVTGQLLAGTYVDGYYLGADGAWVPGN